MIHLYVAVGGVLGALARFAVGRWLPPAGAAAFPWATLLVNVAGSLLLGLLLRALPAWGATAEQRALLTVGLCGSFTTFSTFGAEALALWSAGATATAAAYVAASLALGIGGVAAGLWLGAALA